MQSSFYIRRTELIFDNECKPSRDKIYVSLIVFVRIALT